MTNANGFAGLDGIVRLRPGGLNERGLAVREITRRTPRTSVTRRPALSTMTEGCAPRWPWPRACAAKTPTLSAANWSGG